MSQPTVVICIDGLDPEYLDACELPVINNLVSQGFLQIGRSMMPSVTNVNNVSLLTGKYPSSHGICSNYMLDSSKGIGTYAESSEYIMSETIFQRTHISKKHTLFVTAKDKLRSLLSQGSTISVSSERPPDWLVDEIGPPPDIYSLEVNGWVVQAATFMMTRYPSDFVYITTTDYAMHTYSPEEKESIRHLSIIDTAIGNLVEMNPSLTLLITADHGMGNKSQMVDVNHLLENRGISPVTAIPIIKDKYTIHHSNLGGCMYIYINSKYINDATEILQNAAGIENVYTREMAVDELNLHPDRIGDIVVTADKNVVFGSPSEVAMPAKLRSHGSIHETKVPIIGYNGDFDGFTFHENRDVGRFVFERIL